MERKPRILYIQRDDGGCGFFRCQQPANFIQRMGLAETKSILRKPTPEEILWADLVIMQEIGSTDAVGIANFMVENKVPFIAEIDDFLHHISPHNLGGYGAWNPGTLFLSRAMQVVGKATAVTVSTNQLAREYFPYNRNIYVVPNYLDQEKWDNPITRRNDGKIRIGWMGGNAHADDLKMVSGVIERIVKEGKGKVLFETMGMTRRELTEVGEGAIFKNLKKMNDTCPSCNYEGDLKHYPGEAQGEYPGVLATKGWDIAIAPVINNAFGNCKSDLKVKEYAAAGYPTIASAVVPYKEAAENGAQLILAEGFDSWYNNLKDLIKNPEKRDAMTKANREWIQKHWIQENAQNIFEAYRQVMELALITLGKRNNVL